MNAPVKLKRQTFKTSRLLEFCSVRELVSAGVVRVKPLVMPVMNTPVVVPLVLKVGVPSDHEKEVKLSAYRWTAFVPSAVKLLIWRGTRFL